MDSSKRTARIVGLLIFASYLGLFIGSWIVGSRLDEPGFLADLAADRTRVITGLTLEMINDVVVIGIAVMLYPILKRWSESLALWYVGLRIIEGALYIVGKASALSLIPLSENFIAAGAPDGSFYEGLGSFALDQRDWSGELAAIAFVVGALILYYLLYRSEIVPRFISIWGLLAAASLATAMLLGVPDLTQAFEPMMLLYFPIVANELFLAGWLIVKGFGPSATSSPTEMLGSPDEVLVR